MRCTSSRSGPPRRTPRRCASLDVRQVRGELRRSAASVTPRPASHDDASRPAGRAVAPVGVERGVLGGAPPTASTCATPAAASCAATAATHVERRAYRSREVARARGRRRPPRLHVLRAPRSSAPQIAGPITAAIADGSRTGSTMAPTVAATTPAATPRRPACATADDPGLLVGEEDRHAVGDQRASATPGTRR